jgi:hypothetical protein
MGVYGFAPWVVVRVMDFKLPVVFSVLFAGSDAEGKSILRIELRAPDGTIVPAQIFPTSHEFNFVPNIGVTCVFGINTIFPVPGTYSVLLFADDNELFRAQFKLDEAGTKDLA